jgi:hypothetical protein
MRRCYGEEVTWESLEIHRRMLLERIPKIYCRYGTGRIVAWKR